MRPYVEGEDGDQGLPELTPLLPALDDVGARLAALGAQLRALAGDPEPDLVQIAESVAAIANLSAGLAQDVKALIVRVELHLRADRKARAELVALLMMVEGEPPPPPNG